MQRQRCPTQGLTIVEQSRSDSLPHYVHRSVTQQRQHGRSQLSVAVGIAKRVETQLQLQLVRQHLQVWRTHADIR